MIAIIICLAIGSAIGGALLIRHIRRVWRDAEAWSEEQLRTWRDERIP